MKEYNRWNLDDIIKREDFDKYLEETDRLAKEYGLWEGKLGPEMDKKDFENFLRLGEVVGERLSRLIYLGELMEAANEKDQEAKRFKSMASDMAVKIQERVRKIDHWLKGLVEIDGKKLDDENAKRLFGVIPELEYKLNYGRQEAKHTLSEREENIISNKDINGIGALVSLREMIETEFEYEVKVGAKIQTVRLPEVLALTHSEKAEEREGAYRGLMKKLSENKEKMMVVYQATAKDWDYEARLRGYRLPISMRNFRNQIDDEIVELALAVVKENKGVWQKYFKIKAKQLGADKLRRFDIYAPISQNQRSKIKNQNFREATRLVLESFYGLSERMGGLARKIVDEGHLDWETRENKRNGAFCATVSTEISPYVLMNYTGRMRDVYTLAHELGHGVHSLYARGLPFSVQQSGLPLAETASTLGEMVLFEKLVNEEKDSEIKKEMLGQKLDDIWATTLRQVYFIEFEKRSHELLAKGSSADEMGELWLKTLREQMGEAVEVDEVFANEWLYIPHIVVSPFYCYAYAFGELLTMALYKSYKEDKLFWIKIEKILETGGSRDPMEALREVGVRIDDRKFWEKSLVMIGEWTEKMNKL